MDQIFSTKIYELGLNPYVNVPEKVSEAFAKRPETRERRIARAIDYLLDK